MVSKYIINYKNKYKVVNQNSIWNEEEQHRYRTDSGYIVQVIVTSQVYK